MYFKIYIRKWDGTTETQIANNISETYNTGSIGATVTKDKTFAIEIDVDNYQIKKGENIRITIEMHAWGGAGSTRTYNYGQDPMNRDDLDSVIASASSTELKIWIPFKVEV